MQLWAGTQKIQTALLFTGQECFSNIMLSPQDLIEDLKYELTGKFERLIVSLMRTSPYHDAKEIHDAVKVCH